MLNFSESFQTLFHLNSSLTSWKRDEKGRLTLRCNDKGYRIILRFEAVSQGVNHAIQILLLANRMSGGLGFNLAANCKNCQPRYKSKKKESEGYV